MSKVVTIPKDRNPFVVIVTGVKYSYPAGVATDVPDEVADVIEKYVGAKPKPDPNAGINFGGTQSDWNQTDSSAADFIKNKPFGEGYGDTLTIHAYSEEELMVKLENGEFVTAGGVLLKVSDAIVTMADLSNGCTLTVDAIGGEMDIPAEEITSLADGIIALPDFIAVFVDESGIGVDIDGISFPETGIYLVVEFMFSNTSITIPGYTDLVTVHRLDEKYIPAGYKNEPQIQADWNQTDESAADFIKNKPVTDTKLLGYERENETKYLTDNGVRLTASDLRKILDQYRINQLTIYNLPVTGYGEVGNYIILETRVIETNSSYFDRHYTSEYTPTT